MDTGSVSTGELDMSKIPPMEGRKRSMTCAVTVELDAATSSVFDSIVEKVIKENKKEAAKKEEEKQEAIEKETAKEMKIRGVGKRTGGK